MEIKIVTQSKIRKDYISAVTRFLSLELNISETNYKVYVIFRKGLANKMGCNGSVVQATKDTLVMFIDNKLDFDTMIEVVSHEMVHVKQIVTGQLSITETKTGNFKYTWKGERVRKDYLDRPWEVEAFRRERSLAKKVLTIANS